jgi:hypothetical protein
MFSKTVVAGVLPPVSANECWYSGSIENTTATFPFLTYHPLLIFLFISYITISTLETEWLKYLRINNLFLTTVTGITIFSVMNLRVSGSTQSCGHSSIGSVNIISTTWQLKRQYTPLKDSRANMQPTNLSLYRPEQTLGAPGVAGSQNF